MIMKGVPMPNMSKESFPMGLVYPILPIIFTIDPRRMSEDPNLENQLLILATIWRNR